MGISLVVLICNIIPAGDIVENMKDLSKKYTKVYSYIRFSSAIQEQGDSVRRQYDNCEKLCQEYNLTLSNIKFEDLGVSGYKADHLKPEGALRAFLDMISQDDGRLFPKNKTLLIIDDYSRLGRMEHDLAVDLINSIFRQGISIATASNSQIVDCQTRTSADTIMIVIRMEEAHQESRRKSKYIKSSWKSRIDKYLEDPTNAKKITSQCPSWLTLDKEKNEFKLIPKNVKIVQDIYLMYSQGMGVTKICKHLNENNIKPFRSKKGIWHETTINRIIDSEYGRSTIGDYQPFEIVDGKRKPYGECLVGYYPPIIEKKLYYKVQSIRKTKSISIGRKGKTFSNIFQGIAKCSKCHYSMAVLDKGKKSSGRVLKCSKSKLNSCDNNLTFHLGLFEEAFIYSMRHTDFNKLIDNSSEEHTRVDDLEIEILELEHRLQRMIEIFKESPSKSVAKTITHNEEELETKKAKLHDLLAEETMKEDNSHESILDIIDLLLSQDGTQEEVYAFRSKLNQFLKYKLDTVLFCPPTITEGFKSLGGIHIIFKGKEDYISLHYHHHTSKGVYEINSFTPTEKGYLSIRSTRQGRKITTQLQNITHDTKMPNEDDVKNILNNGFQELAINEIEKLLAKNPHKT